MQDHTPEFAQAQLPLNEIPYGYCCCGCGRKTAIAKRNRVAERIIKGEPMHYARGHNKNCRPLLDRFWEKIDKSEPNGCWLWMACRNTAGYGEINIVPGRHALAHRISYEIANGPIPEGANVLHECDNPPCCNPAHLFLGTQADNVKDMLEKGRENRTRNLRGEQTSWAQLNAAKVRAIRQRWAAGERQVDLAAEYGISQAAISLVTRRLNWTHIE